ncbi:hypothetical protein [Rhodococcoides kroppenstedtii]|uniref:hypothetical protein n=1 Tax=Rhodococcoides kroppenstedtii TaxID=293050 RepID=UPI0036264FD8
MNHDVELALLRIKELNVALDAARDQYRAACEAALADAPAGFDGLEVPDWDADGGDLLREWVIGFDFGHRIYVVDRIGPDGYERRGPLVQFAAYLPPMSVSLGKVHLLAESIASVVDKVAEIEAAQASRDESEG